MTSIRIAAVEEKPLLDHGLVVHMKRHAGAFIGARTLEAAGLDLQRVVLVVVIDIDPSADGMAEECRLDLLRPVAAVGENAPRHRVGKQHVGGGRRDDDLHVEHHGHDPRHRERHTARRRVVALSAGFYVGKARLEDRLVFGRERRLLRAAERLGLIPLIADPRRLAPHTGKIRILAVVERNAAVIDTAVASAMMPSELRRSMRPSRISSRQASAALRRTLHRLPVSRKGH
jgi:hypothetical protein